MASTTDFTSPPADPQASVVHGSAVDQRMAALLDPALLATEHVRRRGSDFGRVRAMSRDPGLSATEQEFELQAIARLRKEQAERVQAAKNDDDEDIEVYKRTSNDIEAVPTSNITTAAPSAEASIRDDTSSVAPIVSDTERRAHNRRSMVHFAALCWCFFLCGWNDGSTGPLLPKIQEYYGIGFAVVSILFIANTCGFIIGAVANVRLTDQWGFGKVIAFGSCSMIIAYSLDSPAGPFPMMCIAFSFAGFGLALMTAQANSYVSCMRDAPTKLGLLHASYGCGAFASPLLATHFATQERWSFHYLVSLSIALLNVAFLLTAFRLQQQNDVMTEAGLAPSEADTTGKGKYRQIWGITAVHVLAVWSLIYIGVEVTLGGWIVTFIQQRRGGGASAGYISSGFFGGLMLGRVVLLWLNRKIGERRVMFLYAFLAIQLEVTVWVVPSLYENAVAVSLIGLLLGPMYPILVNHCKSIIPKWLFAGSVGWITGIGMTGSAMLPFITGLLASRFGIASLQPFIVSMMSCLVVIWAMVPRVRRID